MQAIASGFVAQAHGLPLRLQQPYRKNGLLSENIHALTEDQEGNLWIAQSGGVSKLRYNYKAFENFTAVSYTGEQPTLPSPAVNAVLFGAPADPCDLWVATEGGVACLRKGTSAFVTTDQGLRSTWVNALARDGAGRLWFGTLRGISGLSFSTPLPPGQLAVEATDVLGQAAQGGFYGGASIHAATTFPLPLSQGGQNVIPSTWFAGYHKVYLLVDDEWVSFGEGAGLPRTIYHAVERDDAGYIWIGTRDQGLYRSRRPLALDAIRELTRQDGGGRVRTEIASIGEEVTVPVFDLVWPVTQEAVTSQIGPLLWQNGVMWVGTPEGLFALTSDSLQTLAHLTVEDGLASSVIFSIARSPRDGALWAGTNGGLAEVDPATHTVRRTVTRQEGLVGNEVWYYGSVKAGNDGSIYFGTAKGLSVYRPQADHSNTLEPPLQFRRVEYVEDNSGHNEVVVEYAALSFGNEREVRYRTRLLGYESQEQWSPETRETRYRFTNLPAFFRARPYTFQVIARNEAGVWNTQPLERTFLVAPAWWFRGWAFGLYALVVAALGFFVNRFQRSRLIQRERARAELREKDLRAETAEAWATYLQSENQRQTQELDQARELQLSMLPQAVPTVPTAEVAAYMQTATEVGGDYYDFDVAIDGTLTIPIGDATGHGMRAGTMVTATKSVFNLMLTEKDPARWLQQATRALKRMNLSKVYMSMALGKLHGYRLLLAGAGLPAALIHRAVTDEVEQVSLKGLPLGSFVGVPYHTREILFEPGDTLALMTDGFPELFSENGEMFGYDRVVDHFHDVAGKPPAEIIGHFLEVAAAWRGERPANDDMTFVVVKAKVPVKGDGTAGTLDPVAAHEPRTMS